MSHFVSRPIFTTPTLLTTYTFYLYTFRFYAHNAKIVDESKRKAEEKWGLGVVEQVSMDL